MSLTEFPSHLLPALRAGRAALADRNTLPVPSTVPERTWRPDDAATLSAFIAFARDDLRSEGLADYADFESVAARWFATKNFVQVPIHVPTLRTIWVFYTRVEGWVRTDYCFPGERYGVGEANGGRYVGTLAEALAEGERT
jgi:hypothetical protein